ncbi:MAG: ATP-binding protein [Actinomycetota bacterium]
MTSAGRAESDLLRRLQIVEEGVRKAVARRRATDAAPDDRFRGLYITDEDVDRLLDDRPPYVPARTTPPAAAGDRVDALAREFCLTDLDVAVLLVGLAPDVEPRFERLFAYLHDDVSRRRASTGLALELCGASRAAGAARQRVGPAAPLVANGLLLVEEDDRPFLTRSLRVPDRVTAFLLGDETPVPRVAALSTRWVDAPLGDVAFVAGALAGGERLLYLRGPAGAAFSLAGAALSLAGLSPLAVDLRRLSPDDDVPVLARAIALEARLASKPVVAGPVDALAARGPAAVRALCEATCTMIVTGTRPWDVEWASELPLTADVEAPDPQRRRELWARAVDGRAAPGLDPAGATAQFRLTPDQTLRSAAFAVRRAAAAGRDVTAADLCAGARAQNASGLERLARRVEPRVRWDDLVLPAGVARLLRDLAARARHRERVLDVWGMSGRSSRGRGITALFTGESGTGKTMSAEVVAADLGLDLYLIDLSTIVDKYVGETEKNLEKVFAEAEHVNGILFFDEADALFGKRSEVKESRDRWANVEVAYLLQRMELFDGMAILATNLRANVDDAFTRRLDAVVEFPLPDEAARLRLWKHHLGGRLPLAPDVDVDFLARAFRLAGGNIRNVALQGAYLAAGNGGVVGMPQLIQATEREYHKLGRLCVEAEFGPYHPLLSGSAPAAPSGS